MSTCISNQENTASLKRKEAFVVHVEICDKRICAFGILTKNQTINCYVDWTNNAIMHKLSSWLGYGPEVTQHSCMLGLWHPASRRRRGWLAEEWLRPSAPFSRRWLWETVGRWQASELVRSRWQTFKKNNSSEISNKVTHKSNNVKFNYFERMSLLAPCRM